MLKVIILFNFIRGFELIFQILINAGADINHQDINGNTSLHHASINGQKMIIDYLL